MELTSAGASYGAEAFARLAEELHAAGDVVETSEQVVAKAIDVLEADDASITMIRKANRLETIAPSSPVVEQLDRLQYELREGPCYKASWQGETMTSPDLAGDVRWPLWAPKAAATGVASMMAVELRTADKRVGALNLYFAKPRVFGPDDIEFATIFGRHASVAMESAATESGLIVALDTRKVVGQAQGILMERFDLNEVQAFEVLKRYSQDHNLRMRVVAEHLCETRTLP